jgi:hypothetical protein
MCLVNDLSTAIMLTARWFRNSEAAGGDQSEPDGQVIAELRHHVFVALCWLPLSSARFLANTGLGGRPTVIVVQPVQHREHHYLPRFRLARR